MRIFWLLLYTGLVLHFVGADTLAWRRSRQAWRPIISLGACGCCLSYVLLVFFLMSSIFRVAKKRCTNKVRHEYDRLGYKLVEWFWCDISAGLVDPFGASRYSKIFEDILSGVFFTLLQHTFYTNFPAKTYLVVMTSQGSAQDRPHEQIWRLPALKHPQTPETQKGK